MSDTRPSLFQALEWAKDRAEAHRLQALRWSYDTGWRTEYPTPPVPPPVKPPTPQVLRGIAYKWPR